MSLLAQFKIRQLKGVTEIRFADDPLLRLELAKEMPQYAPLLSELMKKIPSFDELKKTPEVIEFIETSATAGKTYTMTLAVRGVNQVIGEKEVLFVDDTKKICAISRWNAFEGITFRTTN